MKRRSLRPHEKALWDKVARSIEPLRKPPASHAKPATTPSTEPANPPPTPQKERKQPTARPKPHAPPPAAPTTPILAGIDKKAKRKLAKGMDAIDARIDLHGMTQDRAHEALSRFILSSAARGCRNVLVITGKGRGGDGILRRAVPVWLERRDLARFIVGFSEASIPHGGSGALYIRLRSPAKSRKR